MDTKLHADRIKKIPTSIFATMSKMAVEYKAVNLGQGFPDFDGPRWIMEQAFKAMQEGRNQYAPAPGTFSLRRAVKNVQKQHYDLDWDIDKEITITTGATEALYCSIQGLINPGDEVIMFEPYYDSYSADVLIAGGIPKYVTLRKPDFHFDRESFLQKISNKTKMIVLNTPQNPTGKVFSYEELEFIAEAAIENDLMVLSDEVYEFLTFDGEKHIPIAALPGMRDRTITVSSTGKTFGMTGWKIGYACAPETLTEAIRSVRQWTTFAVNTPGQKAMAYAFSRLDDYLPDFRKLYNEKRDFIYDQLSGTSFRPHLPQGSYFIMVDIPEGVFEDDVDASTRLVKEFGVAAIPPSVFYADSDEGKTMLRLCFAKKEETLKEGIEKLKKAV